MPTPRLKTKYLEEIAPALLQEFNYSSPMAAPKLICIKLNIGMGAASQNARLMDSAVEEGNGGSSTAVFFSGFSFTDIRL